MTLFRWIAGGGLLVWWVVGSLLTDGEADVTQMAALALILGALIQLAELRSRRGIADA